ncbi:unnamed protein product [Calypogeia fissa]
MGDGGWSSPVDMLVDCISTGNLEPRAVEAAMMETVAMAGCSGSGAAFVSGGTVVVVTWTAVLVEQFGSGLGGAFWEERFGSDTGGVFGRRGSGAARVERLVDPGSIGWGDVGGVSGVLAPGLPLFVF